MLYQVEVRAEFVMKRLRTVAHDLQAAAFGGTLGAKGRDDHMPARFDRPCDLPHVCSAIGGICKEVEDSSVMPQIVLLRRKWEGAHIAAEPVDA